MPDIGSQRATEEAANSWQRRSSALPAGRNAALTHHAWVLEVEGSINDKSLRSWDEVIIALNDLEARVYKLLTETYVPFRTPEFDAAILRTMRGLWAAGDMATERVSARKRREIQQARKSALAAQRARGVPELVGHLPPQLRPWT